MNKPESSSSISHSREPAPGVPQIAKDARQRRARRVWRRRARAVAAVVAGRASGALARRLRLGGGTTLPGMVARRVDPTIMRYLSAQLRYGSVVITGTNGKTTTSGLVAAVLRAGGLRVWRNREGANLVRGVTAALIIRARPSGVLRRGGNAAAVFEVDEAAFPQVVAELQPRAVIVTNLFRDQLDRYGEVDTVLERWREAIRRLPPSASLVLNADDPAVAALADAADGRVVWTYGVESYTAPAGDGAEPGHDVIDTRTCPRCHAPLTFTSRFYSHIGHWACSACAFQRPQPTIRAYDIIPEGLDSVRFSLVAPGGDQTVRIMLPGLYNVYNALAAVAAGSAIGVTTQSAGIAIGRFMPAFGRAERIEADGREIRLLLAKNPTGLNEVLRMLAGSRQSHHVVMALNDRPADGEDVSWIWDADFERLAQMDATITATGMRAYDLALRLKYAGVAPQTIEPNIARALDVALAQTPPGETLTVVPTYTAMLELRSELERRGYTPPYWEQQDV